MNASDILQSAATGVGASETLQDQMARTVAAFNALTGHSLSARDGWLFMAASSAAMECTAPSGSEVHCENAAAYFALAGECAATPPLRA
jgi:pyrroloquinoline quinone (PQQ) biosynthesis protein C